ncbi:hypothetical protein Scep_000014 [Stephania cephalantha]|uniref:non-specific serine/threonine protein kinase n=1 Tax=Stephania cephalantha TaxID=152367 RepID=A0AAP0L6S5_9MAGN
MMMMMINTMRSTWSISILLILLLFPAVGGNNNNNINNDDDQDPERLQLGSPFNFSHYDELSVVPPATISNGALQITPDSANGGFNLQHTSGRILYSKRRFKLWEGIPNTSSEKIASFTTSFNINIYRFPNSTPGEGFAFIIAPDLEVPTNSHGQFLGLTNATTDGSPNNRLVAVELDTVKQDFDPDDNHMGLDLNSVRSNKTFNLSAHGIQISPQVPKNYTVWIRYDRQRRLTAYMAEEGQPMPPNPIMNESLNLRDYVSQYSYFGFSASTGNLTQLNCVLGWNLTVEMLERSEGHGNREWVKIVVGAGVPVAAVVVLGGLGLMWCYLRRKRRAMSWWDHQDANIVGALKSLPGTPREFAFKDLKKATENFDDKNKLGQGGFGVVYKGVLPHENVQVAVKKFSRDSIKGKVDFLAELTIINRLRHKHLVPLLGWCHRNGMLLLVYDFMPNGSLDGHLFGDQEKTLSWDRRYKVISGVASALHYLHNEYNQRVVHRDLKANNIMLDSDYNARLGDFGLARALDNEKTSYAEMEGVQGTMGYIAPECFHTGKATSESDVFGFGAVVLETVCGQRPWTKIAGFQFLVDWVWTLHRDGRVLEAVDDRLGKEFVEDEAERLLMLGLACCHPIATERPKTQSIFQIVSGTVPVPHVPPFKPAFIWPMMMEDSTCTTNTSINENSRSPYAPAVSSSSSSSFYNVSARRSNASISTSWPS